MKKSELMDIYGGATITGSFISAIAKLLNTVLDVGRSIGTALNYLKNKRTC